jgi:predicted aspartyl protease
VLALDTGASVTLIAPALAQRLGIEPDEEATFDITTASGPERVRTAVIPVIRALGRERVDFRVAVHRLPGGIGIDGLLGLDFVRGTRLTLDFRAGTIDLA